jgi:hypothetical protein
MMSGDERDEPQMIDMLELRAQHVRMHLDERLAQAARPQAASGIRIHLRPTSRDGRARR